MASDANIRSGAVWVLLGFVVPLFCACMVGSNHEAMGGNIEKFKLWYSWKLGEAESNQLTIEENGAVSAHIESTFTGMPVRALGAYYKELGFDDEDMKTIAGLISSRKLVTGETFSMAPEFGARTKIFEIEMDGKSVTHVLNAVEPLPEALDLVEKAIFRLFKKTASGPLRTLAFGLEFSAPAVAIGDDVRLTLSIRNQGKFATELRNPLASGAGGLTTLKVDFWKLSKNDDGSQSEEFEWTLDLSGREFLTGERSAISTEEPYLKLDPGQTLTAWTNLKFPKCDPGSFLTELLYHAAPSTEAESGRDDLVTGQYQSEHTKIRVEPQQASARPGR